MMLGAFAYSRVGVIDQNSTRITADCLPGVYGIGQIQANLQTVVGMLLEHVLARDGQEKARLEAEVKATRGRGSSLLADYEKRIASQREREMFESMSADRASFWATFDEVLRLSAASKNEQAVQMLDQQLQPLHKRYSEKIDNLVSFNKAAADENSGSIQAAVGGARSGILIGLAAALLTAICVSLFVVRSITRPLTTAVNVVDQVAQGDLSHAAEVNSADELGKMLTAMNRMVENLKRAAQIAVSISQGDLTVQAKALSEKDVLGQALVKMLEELRKTVSEVATAASNVSVGSEELSSTAQQLSQGATEQAAAAEESTSSMEEMASSVQQNADNARQTDKIASKAADDARSSGEAVAPHRKCDEAGCREDQHHRRDRPQDGSTGIECSRGSRAGW